MQPQEESIGDGGEAGGSPRAPSAGGLVVSLNGQLPCVQCGYELKGVSILGVCPECGTAVRATLLAVVDPLAAELRPIDRPRLVAIGLLVWVGGFCLAALVTGGGLIRQLLVATALGEASSALRWQAWVVAPLMLAAGIGAVMVSRPHDQVSRRHSVMAWVAAALHLPLGFACVMLVSLQAAGWGARAGGGTIGPLAVIWEPSPDRTLWRVVAGIAGLGVIALMRPVTRVLVARSLALRTGRVDRQTLQATAAAIVVLMAGDLLGLLARSLGGAASEWLMLGSVTMISFGALLLCLGLFSSLVDSVRIARAIVHPGPSLQQVLHGPGSSRAGGRGGGAP
ncbi:MAG: hypothetical protein Q8L55_01740 [Phycisphaerales bacterium]|nr:hypothetical protein [Phycisphaerales bacterium]